jgi:hypothetical protein
MALIKLFYAFKDCQEGAEVSLIKDAEMFDNMQALLEKKYIAFNSNKTKIQQTAEGVEAFRGFCETCECIPCDCDWGN